MKIDTGRFTVDAHTGLFTFTMEQMEKLLAEMQSGFDELQAAIEDARHEGYDAGYNVGYDIGYSDGCDDGYNDGYDEGYADGFDDGRFVTEAAEAAFNEPPRPGRVEGGPL